MDFSKFMFFVCLVIAIILQCANCNEYQEETAQDLNSPYRNKRDHSHGVTGPVHTFVKTDKHANFKWGVRHHVGHHYAGRR